MKALLDKGENYYSYFSYDELLESFEVEIPLQVDQNDYQGDSWVLLKDGDKYGYLVFGWGSCSGCDALQGCRTTAEATELRDDLWSAVKWFDSAKECRTYLAGLDTETQWYGRDEDFKTFHREALELLEAAE